jgi:hypothetical protein
MDAYTVNKEFRFGAKIEVSPTGRVSLVGKASADTIDELEINLREVIKRLSKLKQEVQDAQTKK